MKLKYYLRGIGIGVVVTTIIFMISISIHKNELQSQNVAEKATESKTVAEYESESSQMKDTAATDTQKDTAVTDTQRDTTATEKKESDSKQITDKDNASTKKVTDEKKEHSTQKRKEAVKSDTKNSDKKVRIEISGGEYSDVICRKLKKEGLIDDADAYNKFLVENEYDNFILPGVYEIPMDSTYEEIAVLLTTKVDGD